MMRIRADNAVSKNYLDLGIPTGADESAMCAIMVINKISGISEKAARADESAM